MVDLSGWIEVLEGWLAHPIVGKILTALFVLVVILVVFCLLRKIVVRRIPDLATRYRIRKLAVSHIPPVTVNIPAMK